MTIPSNRRDLFRKSTIGDKLNLFQLLFDAQALTTDLALALLKIIHNELNNHQKPDRTVFRRYAEMVASLRYHVPDLFQQVVEGWKTHQDTLPVEWFDENKTT
jgi:arginine decarboxylase-like protein